MRTSSKTIGGLAIFILMLTSALANAQSANNKTANQPVSSAAATPQKTKSTGNMQNAQSNPMYKDNKMEGTNPLYERDSAASQKKANSNGGTQSNPVFQENQNAGEMPAHGRRESAPANGGPSTDQGSSNHNAQAPQASTTATHDVVEYKDGEDSTTRYRPGNKKTAKAATSAPTKPAEYKDGEDGVSHTRPSNPK